MTVSQAPYFFTQSSVISSQLTSTITNYNKLPWSVLCLQPILTHSVAQHVNCTPVAIGNDALGRTFLPADAQAKQVHC